VFKYEEERQQQLRERARRLIAEARMGVGTHTPQADQGSGPSKLTLHFPSSDMSSIAIQNTFVIHVKSFMYT